MYKTRGGSWWRFDDLSISVMERSTLLFCFYRKVVFMGFWKGFKLLNHPPWGKNMCYSLCFSKTSSPRSRHFLFLFFSRFFSFCLSFWVTPLFIPPYSKPFTLAALKAPHRGAAALGLFAGAEGIEDGKSFGFLVGKSFFFWFLHGNHIGVLGDLGFGS